jgi:hypothetical protein
LEMRLVSYLIVAIGITNRQNYVKRYSVPKRRGDLFCSVFLPMCVIGRNVGGPRMAQAKVGNIF